MMRLNERRVEQPKEPISSGVIERCKRGDEEAWAELVRVSHGDVYTLCLRILGNPDDAAEAAQEAYVKVWRGLRGFRGDAKFETWLYRVAANAAISRQRRRNRRRSMEAQGEDDLLAQVPAPGSVESAVGAKLELKALEKALAALPGHYRSAVVMRDVYGLSIDEIAKQLKVSESAAKVRVHRGRKRLKELMFPSESTEEESSP